MTGIVRTTGIRTQRVLQLDLLVNLIQTYQINTVIFIYSILLFCKHINIIKLLSGLSLFLHHSHIHFLFRQVIFIRQILPIFQLDYY